MANDYKPKAPFRAGDTSGGKPGMNPLFAGIIIGLLLGIFLALGIAIWLNRTTNPFVEKTKPSETLAPMKSAQPPASAKTDGTDPTKPRFEFYQILPGDKDGKEGSAGTPKKLPEPAPQVLKDPVSDVAKGAPKEYKSEPVKEPVKTLNETLYLQVGAFQSVTDADNMKAKVAFAGFEATVKPVNVAGKGTLYRVRLGPFKSQDEVNRIKGVLSQNGIDAAVVKPD
ncbi:MAG: SPOR domain-containing protein [Pseudomonadota bacterium]